MKKSLLLFAMTLMGLTMVAKPVDSDRAVQVARNFVAQYVKGAENLTATVVYTHPMPKSHQPAMYVVNVGNTFVIVSADDIAHPVLGYSLSRPWPTNGNEKGEMRNDNIVLPSQVSGYLDDLAAQIESATGQQGALDRETAAEWRQLLSLNSQLLTTNPPDSVGPLLTTTWDQGQYYNALCPEDPNGPDGHVYTGCVATAMAQIINYWGYPVHGRGIHSYQSNYSTLTVNYDSANYDYANMPNELTATSSPAQVNSVAKLMYDCGVSVNMGYAANGSGTDNISTRIALINNFLFGDNLSYVCKQWFRFSEWDMVLHQQLNDSLPVIYSGMDTTQNVGHAFVCDGFKTDGFFHFNFGWSGNGDGWFRTSSINPGYYDFNSTQAALINILPSSNNSTLLNYLHGKSTFMVDSSLHVYYSMGLNMTRGAQDNLYWDWDTIVFYSSNDESQLEFNLNRHPNVYNGTNEINVFDGENADSLLHQYNAMFNYWNGTLNLDRTPIVSTRGALTVECIGFDGFDGFDFVVGKYNGCKRVSNVTTEIVDSSVVVSWTENGEASQWQIEYGLASFEHGDGIVLTVDTNFVLINGLSTSVEYDVYVRPKCNDTIMGEWSQKNTFIVGGSYWKDIVMSQPEGYQIEPDSNIYINSAEGLAWLINVVNSQYNQLDGWTVHLTNDIDLYGHTWTPIHYFKGRFEGHGHIIYNMFAIGDGEGQGGLFGDCWSPWINDVHLRNSYVAHFGTCGSIAGNLLGMDLPEGHRATIINSSATGTVYTSTGRAGGLVGNIMYSSAIINCWSSCNVTAQTEVGGICASGYKNCLIQNCYTGSTINSLGIVYAGAVAGYSEYTVARNCYALMDNIHPLNNLFEAAIGAEFYDLSGFSRDDTIWRLVNSVSFEDYTTDDLIEALNAGVANINNEGMRMWIADTNNDGLPIFGPIREIVCPNVSNICLKNIIDGNNENGLEVSFNENGSANLWELRYKIKDSIEENHVFLYQNPDTIYGLEQQQVYLFSIRPICDSIHRGAWIEDVSYYIDRPYWKDMVTSQPDGYSVDIDGNVAISSAEGLAWLISTVNGFNGEPCDIFQNKKVLITRDIDLGQYKWSPINNFIGNFDGRGHVISNLFVNEVTDYCGFFGTVNGGKYENIIMDSAYVKCKEYAGILFGEVRNADIINCHVSGSVYAELEVGGFAGRCENSNIDRGSSVCSIQAMYHYGGGLFGSMFIGVIRNSFSRSNVIVDGYGAGGLIGPSYSGIIENCYAVGDIFGFMYIGGISGSLRAVTPSAMRNCYAAGTVFGSGSIFTMEGGFTGAVVGATDANPIISNCYGMTSPLIGPAEYGYDNGYPIIADTSVFALLGDSLPLANNISVGNNYYTDLLSALNAWVDANDTSGIYRYWAADSTGENGGYPVFAYVPCITLTAYDSIVVCDSYTWYGNVYTTSTDLIDTLSTMMGCDSIVTHHLIVNHSATINDTVTACEDYFFGGQWIYSSGQYTDTLTNAANCDSIVTLNLTINNPVHTAVTEVACDSYTWQGATLTTSGTYTYPHNDANGCTQVDTLHLTINHSNTGIETVTACDNYTWHGTAYTASNNTATFTETNADDCDSVVTLNLTVNYSNTGIETVTACDAYTWHGANYTASTNTPIFTETNANGCDSVVTLNLTINYSNTNVETITACDSYTWHGTAYAASTNTPTFTETNVNGCDSVVALNLTVNYSNTGIETVTACDNYIWHGNNYTASNNTATFIETNAAGCDSVVTLQLTINQSTAGDTIAVACDAFAWYENFYTASGTHTRYTTNAAGCDSTVTLHLTINSAWCTVTTETACDSYFWYDSTYTTSGTYTYSFVDSNGCSGINTLHLAIVNAVNTAMTETACDTYTWNGTPYTASGNYTYSHLDANGCTQVDTLHLTINYSDAVNEIDTACEDYFFGGQWISVSGQYIDSLTNLVGCDSIITLNLTINNPVHEAVTEVACDSYTWQGATITVSGDYTFPHDDANGCTQVDTLHLTINYSVETTVTDTAEDSYSWQGNTYTESGTYQWQGTTAEGCDSTVTLMLVINHVGIGEIDNSKMNIDVYPNPTTGQLTIDAEGILSVEVFDPTGRKVATHERTNNIDLAKFPTGTYLLKIHLPSGTSLQRVILK
ncbi:MAG: thiol protease/hemagglutinin PrtT [Bacteroidales bacterium]|nr:thiol protease/hemagglutinin PrtT [Bacteroidales bacterium]